MKYGLPETAVEKLCAVFAGFPAVEKAVLYGSRAKGNFKTGSDIDLTLYGEALTSDLCSAVASALDDLLLPYTIDLSVFEELNHAKLREHIERVGVLFYERAQQGAAMKKGWLAKSFEDCLEDVVYTRKVQRKDFLAEGKFPIVSQEADFINGYWNDPADLFKLARPAIIFGDHTQVIKYVDFDFVLGADGVKVLRPRDFLLPKFLYYYLLGFPQKDLGYARHYRLLRELEIPYPTLPEQQRIVGILDEAFEGIANAKANAEKNLQNARAIFESHLQSVFTQRGKGWVEKRLAAVCAITSTLVDPREKEFLDLTHVGAGNIESKTGVFVDLKTAREEGLISGKFLFDESMVLYSKIRPYLMKVARPDFPGLCSADMYPLSPFQKEITRDYLFHLLLSKEFTDYAILGSARAGMPKVNREHLFEFKVWLPEVKKQKELAAKLDDLHEETQRLATLYERKLTALEALKKSLLHQAFTGEL